MEKIKIIYILSSGHSGSTLINSITSTSSNVFSVGEIKFLKEWLYKDFIYVKKPKFFKDDYFKCDCGEYIKNCRFWSSVIQNYDMDYFFPIKSPFVKNIEYLCNFLLFSDIKEKKYDEEKLLHKISKKSKNLKNSNNVYILDASKNPSRLMFLLSEKYVEEIKVIYLTRDQISVINSNEKLGVFWLRSYFKWIFDQIINNIILLKVSKKNKIKFSYDLFVQNPSKFIRELNNKFNLNIDTKNFMNDISKEKSHIFCGNITRYKKKQKLIYDQSWKRRMPKWKQWVLTILCYIPNKLWVYNRKL